MLLPIGPVKNLPVTVMNVLLDPPVMAEAVLIHFDGRAYEVRLKSGSAPFKVDDALLVDFNRGDTGRRRVRVQEVEGPSLRLELEGRPRNRDRREFPRIEGKILLQYALVPGDDPAKLEKWLEHPHLTDASVEWFSADPDLEFSVTGFRFRCEHPLPPGTLLNLRFRLIQLSRQRYYVGGEVVRLEPTEQPELYSVAVSLVGAQDATTEALVHYTRHCQDDALGLLPEQGEE